ncbi:MAG: hypothetical protein ACLFPO_11225 [Spirochaetaceae bacterium]
MQRLGSATAGFIALSATTLYLFAATAAEAASLHAVSGVVSSLILVGLLTGIDRHGRSLLHGFSAPPFGLRDLTSFLFVSGGAVAAFLLSVEMQLGPVIGAAMVGLIAGLFIPRYGVPAYCGAFVGMASEELLCLRGGLFVAAAVAGLVFVLSEGVFGGFGGKLGTIALTGCIVAALVHGRPFLVSAPATWSVAWALIPYSAIAAVATFYLSVHLGHGAVPASSIVGLVGGLLLPPLHPTLGSAPAVVVICASFAGMSTPQRLPALWAVGIAGALAGLVFVYSAPYLGGAGGKLGTIAFGSVIAVNGILALFHESPAVVESQSRSHA